MGSLALDEVRRLDGRLVLIAGGLVDDTTVESFERALDRVTRGGSRRVIVDLTRCRLDSAGLAALVRLRRRAGRFLVELRLVVADVELFRMLQIIGLASHFPTYLAIGTPLRRPPAAPSPVASTTGADVLRFERLPGRVGRPGPTRARSSTRVEREQRRR